MKRSKSIKPNPKRIIYPKVTHAYWQFSGKIWRTYQLPDGQKLMSDRQIALFVGCSKNAVQEFIESRRLETYVVRVGNNRLMRVCPLSVVAIYLSTLLREGRLKKHHFKLSRDDWHCLIRALSHSESESDESNPILNCYFFTGNYLVESGETLPVEFDVNMNLQVLALHCGEYRIDYREGLRCINRSPNWFIHDSAKKAKYLANLGLSRDILECRVRIKQEFQSMYGLSLQDWLSIWGYFAKRGNRRAITLLNVCARERIEVLIARAISENK